MILATKKISDFRYDTGEARVPWATVGEKVNVDDIGEIIKTSASLNVRGFSV